MSNNHTLVSCSLSLQTYIGSVVISMNPYRSLPIYTPQKVEEYRNRNFYELSPHMWVPCLGPSSTLSWCRAVYLHPTAGMLLCRMRLFVQVEATGNKAPVYKCLMFQAKCQTHKWTALIDAHRTIWAQQTMHISASRLAERFLFCLLLSSLFSLLFPLWFPRTSMV